MVTKSEIAGFLLAGGQSSRMGSNKALLLYRGELLVQRGLRVLAECCSEVAIAGGVPELSAYGRVIPDLYPGQGPLSGIVSALEQTSAEWNLFLAVDMPAVSASALRLLLAAADKSAMITLAEAAGQVQPLCGVYSRRALSTLRAELQRGNRKVRVAAEATGACTNWSAPNPAWFVNLNTPEEFALAEQQDG